jgi:hypothetical protein
MRKNKVYGKKKTKKNCSCLITIRSRIKYMNDWAVREVKNMGQNKEPY